MLDIEQLLQDGKNIQISPQGYSMYPLLVPGRDEVIVEPVRTERLRRGEVVLYRRNPGRVDSMLVLHRIWKKKEEGFYMVGDNQKAIEGPLRKEQIKGVMVGMYRKGKYYSVKHPLYQMYSILWLSLRPVRPILSKIAAVIKRLLPIHTS